MLGIAMNNDDLIQDAIDDLYAFVIQYYPKEYDMVDKFIILCEEWKLFKNRDEKIGLTKELLWFLTPRMGSFWDTGLVNVPNEKQVKMRIRKNSLFEVAYSRLSDYISEDDSN